MAPPIWIPAPTRRSSLDATRIALSPVASAITCRRRRPAPSPKRSSRRTGFRNREKTLAAARRVACPRRAGSLARRRRTARRALRRGGRLAQFRAAQRRTASRQGGARPVLDLHLRELASHHA